MRCVITVREVAPAGRSPQDWEVLFRKSRWAEACASSSWGAPERAKHVQVPEERCLGDPPLLRLESEASHAYLSTLLDLRAGGPDVDPRVPRIDTQLTALCVANLQRFKRVGPADNDSLADGSPAGTPPALGEAPTLAMLPWHGRSCTWPMLMHPLTP